MAQAGTPLDRLKRILENLRHPERLDAHPWTGSLTVREAIERDASLKEKSPGTRLVLAIAELFRLMQPATPPLDGKRLDTRWGRFGILAANYFAPLLYGRAYPHTMREAWRRIDQAILLFVYGVPADQLDQEQVRPYRLVGDEIDMPANSTISDWHRSGLQEMADLFIDHEKHLSLTSGKPSPLFEQEGNGRSSARRTKGAPGFWEGLFRKRGRAALAVVMLAVLAFAGIKSWRIHQQMQVVKGDMKQLEQVDLTTLQAQSLEQMDLLLNKTYQDVEALRAEAGPWLWMTPALGWMPVYGGDLRSAGDLLEMASALTRSASQACQVAIPIWETLSQDHSDLKASELTGMLLKAEPDLLQAQATLQQAVEARRRIVPEGLSESTRSQLTRADTYLSNLDEALSLSLALPRLLGGSKDGPKTYLVLIQNEDELRPTGGFITAVGKVVVWNGELISWKVDDSYSVDDINKAYPPAPWQMQSFMNIPIMTFRDANWFPDYPTAVLWAEYLYAYTNSFSVNGVIAVDQHVLSALLAVTGPVEVEGIGAPLTSKNIEQVMRAQKVPPSAEANDPNWYRKHFLNPIASAVLDRVLSGHGLSWKKLMEAMLAELDQKHILVQVDDPVLSKLLAERSWDGSIVRGDGDFLMVVDTNVGYNKTNAVVDAQLTYDVNLGDLSRASSNLAILQHNGAQGSTGPCTQRPEGILRSSEEFWYPIERCYYDYLRVYLPAGTRLQSATPHAVTRAEMVLLDRDVPARVDTLEDELPGLQGFGTLLVVPMGKTLETDFQFDLPPGIFPVDPVSHEQVYRLKVQKQPGTGAVPVTVRVHLPSSAKILSVSPEGSVQQGNNLLFDLALKTDVNIQIRFQP